MLKPSSIPKPSTPQGKRTHHPAASNHLTQGTCMNGCSEGCMSVVRHFLVRLYKSPTSEKRRSYSVELFFNIELVRKQKQNRQNRIFGRSDLNINRIMELNKPFILRSHSFFQGWDPPHYFCICPFLKSDPFNSVLVKSPPFWVISPLFSIGPVDNFFGKNFNEKHSIYDLINGFNTTTLEIKPFFCQKRCFLLVFQCLRE